MHACNKINSGGKNLELYGTHRVDIESGKRDWVTIFKLLNEGRIKPVIFKRFPLIEAVQAKSLLESGQIIGNVVLLT